MNYLLENLQIFQKSINKLKKQNEKLKKDLEILKIIKKKYVNVFTLINSLIGAINPLDFYNEKVSTNLKLTKKEFDLLKEWLENETIL